MRKLLTEKEINERLLAIHKGMVSMDYSTFSTVNKKGKFIDIELGELWDKDKLIVMGIL